MNKGIINQLLKKHKVKVIEQHLIYTFLKNKSINFVDSSMIVDLFKDFTLNAELSMLVSSLGISDLKQLENYLELIIPKHDRKVNGAFFTPTYIVDYIINQVTPTKTDKCLDPSCGSGAFLIGLVSYFKNKHKKSIKQCIQQNIYGSDILDYNVRRAKILLSIYGLLNDEIIEDSDFNIYHQDSLKAEWTDKYEVVVGNPPYVKYQDMSDGNRTYLIENWQTIKNGTFNLYFAFFELGYNLLSANGRLGYITPNNYFTSLAGLSLRQFFLHKKCLKRIIDFRHKKVFDAQTYTAITIATKQKNDFILYDKILDNQMCPEFLEDVNGSPNYWEILNVKKWRLLKTQEQENIRIIETTGIPIKQLFNIAVGIATLKDDVFFVNGSYKEGDYYTKTTDKGTFLIEKSVTKPVYKISRFKTQAEIENNTLRIITPYKTASHTVIPICEKEFKDVYPKCYEYLLSEKENLKRRDKGKVNFDPFYVWGRTQGILRKGKKILNPTFSKNPRFLYVSEEDAYFTNGYGIYFKKQSSQNTLFGNEIHPISKEENALLAQKILNSVIMDYYVRTTSVSIQGGYPCYQKNFIEKFTIPHFSEEELQVLDSLTDQNEIDAFLVEKYQVNIPFPNLVP